MKKQTIKRADENFFFRGNGIVRFRPLLLLFLSLGLGIFLYFLLGIYALLVNAGWFLAAGGAFIYKRATKKSVAAFLAFTAIACIFYSIGGLSFGMRVNAYERSQEISGMCAVAGEIKDIGESGSATVLKIDSLEIIDEDGNLFCPAMKMQLYIADGFEARIGMRVLFEARVETYDVWCGGRLNAEAMIGNVRYRASIYREKIVSSDDGVPDVFSIVRGKMRDALFENMDGQTASLAYGMLTGDSGYMDEDVLQNFRYGGIAHIFAVSGLHIGVIYGLLSALLKRVNGKNYIKLPVIFFALLFYVGVCGFSPSSVRALIMCSVLMLANAGGYQYDRLNSVSLSGLIILTVNPIYLFSVGFRLSFFAALGIVVLGGHIGRGLKRIQFLPSGFCSALGVALSAQLGTFPVLLDCFGYVSGIGLFLNLIFVPIISFVYALLFLCTVLACFLPFAAGVILYLPGFLLRLAVMPILMLEFKILLICGFSFGACAVLWYAALFFVSDKVNLKPVPKLIGTAIFCCLLSVVMVFQNNTFCYDAVLTLHSYYDSNVALLRFSEGDYLISFGNPDQKHIERIFLKEGIEELDGVLFLSDARSVNTGLPVILRYADVKTLYVSAELDFENSFHTVDVKEEDGFFNIGEHPAAFLSKEILYLNVYGSDVLLCAGTGTDSVLPQCDLLVATRFDEERVNACVPDEEVYFEKTYGKLSVYSAGDLQIAWKNAIISVKSLE